MQLGGDLESLEGALSTGQHEPKDRVIGAGKCSALIKLLPHNSELFVSHDTWDDYQGMLRTYKLYDLKFKTSPIGQLCIHILECAVYLYYMYIHVLFTVYHFNVYTSIHVPIPHHALS